jgi:hypothetical protein
MFERLDSVSVLRRNNQMEHIICFGFINLVVVAGTRGQRLALSIGPN